METSFGFAFDPLRTAPAIIASAAGLVVWRRHRADRRAQLFLLLALSELALVLVVSMMLLDRQPVGALAGAALMSAMFVIGGVSIVLFFHFGMVFPHKRPWLTRTRIRLVYLIAVAIGAAPLVAGLIAPASATAARLIEGSLILFGPLAIVATIVACFAVHRSYREMTASERATYRAPVLGVLAGMVIALLADLLLGWTIDSDNRRVALAGNVLGTAAGLLFPLFFFTAATKYRLLERHSQDYIAKL